MTQLRDAIAALAQRIEEQWKNHCYDYAAFPEIACAEIRALGDLSIFGEQSLQDWLLSVGELPKQFDPHQKFGDPPITLFHSGKFLIDAYVWLTPLLAVHDHAFCGAFAVVSGSTVQVTYHFDERQEIARNFRVGDLIPVRIEAMPPGSIMPIIAGEDFIHATWHLAKPTISLCVRTVKLEEDYYPQFHYYPPHFALADLPSPITRRFLSLLSLQSQIYGREALEALVCKLLDQGDSLLAFHCLRKYISLTADWKDAEPVIDRLQSLYPALFTNLREMLRWTHREAWHYDLSKAAEPEQRLLLGLLQTYSSQEQIVQAMRSLYPGQDPAALLIRWIESASASGAISAEVTPANSTLIRLALKKLGGADGLAVSEARGPLEVQLLGQLQNLEALKPLFMEAPRDKSVKTSC